MGLLGWIKKESLQLRRRESAPPVITHSEVCDPDVTRDEAYMKALAKFNEWRSTHTNSPQLNFTTNFITAGDEQWQPIEVDNREAAEDGGLSDISSDIELTEKERHKLLQNRNLDIIVSHQPKKLTKKSVDFYRNINKIPQNYASTNGKVTAKLQKKDSKRFSLPAKMSKASQCLGKEFSFSKKSKKQIVQNNNTIYEDEVEEFEQHCKNRGIEIQQDPAMTQTPPSRFYKENSSPFHVQSEAFFSPKQQESNYATPKKPVNIRKKPQSENKLNHSRTQDPNISLPKILLHNHRPKVPDSSDSSSTLPSSGSCNQMTVFDEFVVAVTHDHPQLKKTENNSKHQKVKRRRVSPPYQCIVNKHGDLVEYALPYSEQETTTDDQAEGIGQYTDQHPPPNTPIMVHPPAKVSRNLSLMQDLKHLEDVVNENFQFLNEKSNVSAQSNDTLAPIREYCGRPEQPGKQKVTDLDRSTGSTATTLSRLVSPRNSKNPDIFSELDSLEKWSKTLQMADDLRQTPKKMLNQNGLDFYLKTHNLLICWPSEIKYRVGQLKSAFPSPLDFSSGCFRNTPVIVRKATLNDEKNLNFAEQASKRDFEIMSQVKHADIATLMAITFDQSLNQISLVMEPFDFTLNYFLHQMDKNLTVIHCISIVQQIAQATLYLQECGYIHSNISSHCVLMRKFPHAVKLSCFEMTTDVMNDDIKREIETTFGHTSSQRTSSLTEFQNLPKYSLLLQNSEKYLKDKYKKLSKQPPYLRTSSGDCDTATKRPEILPQYLPHHLPYRQKFTLHYYQAPELLAQQKTCSFVYPHKNSDVYSLTLLLWEVLNECVPFVIFNYDELEKLYAMNQAILPIFEEDRCKDFRKVFEYGLETAISNRTMSVQRFIAMLDDVKQNLMDAGESKTLEHTVFEDNLEMPVQETRRNSGVNDVSKHNQFEKTEKDYFNTKSMPDPHKREENAITTESLGLFNFTDTEVLKMSGLDATSTDNRSSELDQNIQQQLSFVSLEQTPAILLDEVARKIRADTGSMIKELGTPASKSNVTGRAPLGSSLNWSNSTIHQSIVDFNPRKLPKTENQPIYERTSTLKKRQKAEGSRQRPTAKELFNLPPDDVVVVAPPRSESPEKYEDLDRHLDAIADDVKFSRDDFLAEIMNELQVRSPGNSILESFLVQTKEEEEKKFIQTDKQTFLNNLLKDNDSSKGPVRVPERRKKTSSKYKDLDAKASETPTRTQSETKRRINKYQTSSGPSSYRFNIGDFTLPETPIARRNKIRRNAWLSDQELKVSPVESPAIQDVPKEPHFVKCVMKDREAAKKAIFSLKPEAVPVKAIVSPKPETTKETTIQQSIELRHLHPQPFPSDKKELNVRVKVIHNRKGADSFTSYHLEPFTVKNDINSSILGMIKLTDTGFKDAPLEGPPEIRMSVVPKQKIHQKVAVEAPIASQPPPPPPPPPASVNRTVCLPITVSDLNPGRLNKTTSNLDDSIRPNMPELLSEAFKRQKNRSLDINNFEKNLWKREKDKCDSLKRALQDDNDGLAQADEPFVVSPHRRSVRDVIKSIEKTFPKTDHDYSLTKPLRPKKTSEPVRTVDTEAVIPGPSISKLNVTLTNKSEDNTPTLARQTSQSYVQQTIVRESIFDTSECDTTSGSLKKMMTTRVTVNMKQISRRSSDVDIFKRPQLGQQIKDEYVRHSFGGCELMKTLSQLVEQQPSSSPERKEEPKAAEGLVATGAFGTPMSRKLVCCNCGSPQIVPIDLQNLPPGSTFSIPPLRDINVTDGFRNTIFDDGSRWSELTVPGTPVRKVQTAPFFQIQRTPQTRSTEDLYIDDDFCQGLSLGANMELFAEPDSPTDMDFVDFLSTEIFHRHDEVEQTNDDKAQLQLAPEPKAIEAIAANDSEDELNLIAL